MFKKILIVANVVKTHIMQFHIPTLKMLKEMGYEVHVAARNDYQDKKSISIPFCDKYIDINFERSPLSINNIKAYKQLKELLKIENYNIVHCHAPVPSVLTRLVVKNTKLENKPKVIYTAHGFHFYKGASIKKWLVFYPIEKYLSKYTDVLITINQEDYFLAKTKFKAKQTKLINGVGVDLKKFKPLPIADKAELRRQLGFRDKDFIIVYVAELVKNKRQLDLIKTISQLKKENVKLLLIGQGVEFENYDTFIKAVGLSGKVKLLGYQQYINEWLNVADLYVSPSEREGLPVNILEALAVGLPVVASDCRGNRDLVIKDSLFGIGDIDKLKYLMELKISKQNYFKRECFDKYSKKVVLKGMRKIYENEHTILF